MANVYAIISGNWSNPSIWNTGALPTAADDVFSNGLTVQVNVTTTVLSVRNTAASPIIAGGTFILNPASDLTCTAPQGIVVGAASTPVVQFTSVSSGSAATLRANITSVPLVASYSAIQNNGLGTLNILGDLSFAAASGINNRNIINHVNGITNIVGTLTMTFLGTSINNNALQASNGAVIITGQVTGGGQGGSNQIILGGSAAITINGDYITNAATNIAGGSSIIVNGSVTNNGTGVAITSATANVNVTGAVTVNNTGAGVSSTTGIITLGGPIAASNSGNGVVSTLGLVKCSGLLFNSNQFQAVFAPKITIEATTSSITYQTFASGNQIMYVGSSGALGQPTANNVRFGTVYGAASEFTGTLRVPNPNTVLLGTLTDNTTGTYTPSSPADYVNELNTSSIAVAVRLRNCATVDTTGSQIASYNI